jgi:iron complex transport system substrate-binding protein
MAPTAFRLKRPSILMFLLPVLACAGTGDGVENQPVLVDDLGQAHTIGTPPKRIVSLIPSMTELVLMLGVGDRLVGRTDFDNDPRVAQLPSVGGGLDPSIEALVALEPELVIAWPGGDLPLATHLENMGIGMYAAEIQSLDDLRRHTVQLGRLLGAGPEAHMFLSGLDSSLAKLDSATMGLDRPTALYVVWHDPPMTAGPGTFLDEVITLAGGRNIFGDAAIDWPQISMEEILKRDPDALILPVKDVHDTTSIAWVYQTVGWKNLRAVRDGRLLLVDTELFNRPGPGVVLAANQLAQLLHPQLAPVDDQ